MEIKIEEVKKNEMSSVLSLMMELSELESRLIKNMDFLNSTKE
jgi:hypothetical protein